jgi:hypothetical protein
MPQARTLIQTNGGWIVSSQVDFVASRSYVCKVARIFPYFVQFH